MHCSQIPQIVPAEFPLFPEGMVPPRPSTPEMIREEYHSLVASVLSELITKRFLQFTHDPVMSRVTKQHQVR